LNQAALQQPQFRDSPVCLSFSREGQSLTKPGELEILDSEEDIVGKKIRSNPLLLISFVCCFKDALFLSLLGQKSSISKESESTTISTIADASDWLCLFRSAATSWGER
jgi:hypothetical protein